jgi:divalent metal cation (Fe/Co/Zn/Cd) transporter
MIRALMLGLRELTDPGVQRLLLRCVLLALATFVLLIGAVAGVLFGFDWTGIGWLDPVLATAGSVAALVLAWLLFPVAIGLILGRSPKTSSPRSSGGTIRSCPRRRE